jgi:hypothetical protein
MKKIIIVVVAVIAVYFTFFKDPYPSSIIFQEINFGSKNEGKNSGKKLNIFTYRDDSNAHSLSFALMQDSTAMSVSSLLDYYLGYYEARGYKFEKDGSRFLGVSSEVVMYIAEAENLNGVVFYKKKLDSPSRNRKSDASALFDELEGFSF